MYSHLRLFCLAIFFMLFGILQYILFFCALIFHLCVAFVSSSLDCSQFLLWIWYADG